MTHRFGDAQAVCLRSKGWGLAPGQEEDGEFDAREAGTSHQDLAWSGLVDSEVLNLQMLKIPSQ